MDDTVFWIHPPTPTRTTFQQRQLDALLELGVPVEPVSPTLEPIAALRGFLRRPLRGLRVGFELQRYKARKDRERGRAGYVVLMLRALAVAERLEGRAGRVHGVFADGVGTIAYALHRLAGRPYSFEVHAPFGLFQGSCLLARQARAADVVACVSEDMRRRILELEPSVCAEVVRCGAPIRAPQPRAPDTPYWIACVGFLQPLKGFRTGIEGFAVALRSHPDLRLEVMGAGPQEVVLRRRAAELGIADSVHFAGHLPNEEVLRRLTGALALLMPSEVQPDGDRDGLPVAILDAAACGVAAIATPVSGIPEFVLDGQTGLIVPERAPAAIGATICKLVDDPVFARTLGANARALAHERHDARVEAARLAELWSGRGAV